MTEKEDIYVTGVTPRPTGLSDEEKMPIEAGSNSNISLNDGETKEDVFAQLRVLYLEHQLDFNFPQDLLIRAKEAIDNENADPNHEHTRQLVSEFHYQKHLALNDSPYPEVRSVVDPTDDPTTPVNTFRVWVLGTIFAILGTGIDQFFSLRYPSISIYSYLIQFLAFPCGLFMAKVLPTARIPLGPLSFTLNPGPFNQKEHILITIMANVAFGGFNGTAYVTYILQVLRLPAYYNDQSLVNNAGWQITLVLATQFIGYGTAGLARRFLVYPQSMIWPRPLAQIAINKALHNENGREGDMANGWRISRLKFFLYCFAGMFLYYWFPGYIFQALSYFNWMTWISPTDVVLAVVTGSVCGLGINPLSSFDWNVASVLIDPIITPFFSYLNLTVGMLFTTIFFVFPIFFKNVWNTAYFDPNSSSVFDNTGEAYNVSKVLNDDFTLNEEAYKAYSPPYLSASYAVLYMFFFAAYTAAISHTLIYNWNDLKIGYLSIKDGFTRGEWFKSSRDSFDDVHNRLMREYKDCPESWYLALLAISFILACVSTLYYPTGFPVWGIFLAIAFSLTLQVPLGMIMAMTNNEITLNVVAELIAGYTMAGKPIANMIFKMFGYVATAQSIQFCADLKLAHYSKIPPRLVFMAQVWATIWGSLTSIGVNDWQLSNIENVCTSAAADHMTCPGTSVFFTASVIWGVVGPQRMFSDGIYNATLYGFLWGFLLPIPFYFLAKRFPTSWVRNIHIPVFLSGSLNLAPYNNSYFLTGLYPAVFFNVYVKKRYQQWWQKYALVLTTSFQVAIALSALIIFFSVSYHPVTIDWWGNDVSFAGADGTSCALKAIPASGHF
ncbi:hypothetical protein N0V93_008086 [Gnomoniopsis smithogilvyi]|uniref:OPT family small oligopeptide transporter n=1 Tax=Gnomoniopsis smithogilvyi TaxID=1191159 RepID=A0A9W8YMB4_9PEZI|nr:hypothetical protein N0V93_008086 [Gnomoniopsis smithogilvyi]